jgi:hypothetical protein
MSNKKNGNQKNQKMSIKKPFLSKYLRVHYFFQHEIFIKINNLIFHFVLPKLSIAFNFFNKNFCKKCINIILYNLKIVITDFYKDIF